MDETNEKCSQNDANLDLVCIPLEISLIIVQRMISCNIGRLEHVTILADSGDGEASEDEGRNGGNQMQKTKAQTWPRRRT